VADLRAPGRPRRLAARLIGNSPAIERLRQMIAGLGDTAANVLIHGETGTGKELVARCLHEASGRRAAFRADQLRRPARATVRIEIFGHEAGAFTGAAKRRIGKIEHAEGGTLFLDEIESMPMPMQIKLLRVLQERVVERLGSNQPVPVNARVVAATKADLRALADAGQFRADLYYRLNVVTLELPPLRERRETSRCCSSTSSRRPRCASNAKRCRPRQPNGRACGLPVARQRARTAQPGRAPCAGAGLRPVQNTAPPAALPLPRAVEQFERALIADALRRHDGNLTRAGGRWAWPRPRCSTRSASTACDDALRFRHRVFDLSAMRAQTHPMAKCMPTGNRPAH
jgi:two-component system C4-dicarboxylate transport response regulator DctD